MEPRIIRYVLMLANERNFSKAARKLYISQPSLSYQISKIENELGVKLFTRGKKEVQLTYAGEKFVNRANRIIDEINQLRNEMADVTNLTKGRLTIGSLPTTGAYLLPKAITAYKEHYPNIELVLKEDTTDNLELLVSRGDIDISLLAMPVGNINLSIETIIEEDIYLTIPKSHPLAHLEEANILDFREEHFILTNQYSFRKRVVNIFDQVGIKPKIIFESSNITTCESLVVSGLGITFVPQMILDNSVFSSSLVYLPIKKPLYPKRNIVLAYKSDRYLSRAARNFIDVMKRVINNR